MLDWIYKIFDWRGLFADKFNPDKKFVGYGPVNNWAKQDFRKWTAEMLDEGVGMCHIEAFAWGASNESEGQESLYDKPSTVCEKLEELVFWCKRRKLGIFISLVNDNKGKGKYGDDTRDLSYFRDNITIVLDKIVRLMKDYNRIYVQPVAETQTSTGVAIEKECVSKISYDKLVYNGNGGFPTSKASWAKYFAQHPSSTSKPISQGAWCVTDHSTILNELGGLNADGHNNELLTQYAKTLVSQNIPFIHYGFAHKKFNKGNIKAIGKAL